MKERRLIHLSDLHLLSDVAGVPPFWDHLLTAIGDVAAESDADLGIVISGDVFDCTSAATDTVERLTRRLVDDLRRSAGADAPVLIVPGNHDRRVKGLQSPWGDNIVRAMTTAAASMEGVHVVASNEREPHATLIEPDGAFLGLRVVCYDSTHTYRGAFSAGGHVRTDDLFAVRGIVGSPEPVILVLHHHLVPTPVTDVERVNVSGASSLKRFAVHCLLPRIISFGDREEVFMTALGAGSLLTSLHALGSPVLVLHGHKHYPAARCLSGLRADEGDVIVAAAGSAGVNEPYHPTLAKKTMWPSFNVVTVGPGAVNVDTIFFSPRKTSTTYRQPLASAQQVGASWRPLKYAPPSPEQPTVTLDEAHFHVVPEGEAWSFRCDRTVSVHPSADVQEWSEPIETASGATVEGERVERRADANPPHWLTVVHDGTTSYKVAHGLCGARDALKRLPDESASPFEWLGLTVRKPAEVARLVVEGLPADRRTRAFATMTDLSTGARRPVALRQANGKLVAEVPSCAAKRLLQVLWPI